MDSVTAREGPTVAEPTPQGVVSGVGACCAGRRPGVLWQRHTRPISLSPKQITSRPRSLKVTEEKRRKSDPDCGVAEASPIPLSDLRHSSS